MAIIFQVRTLAVFLFCFVYSQLAAQESYPICSPPSQKTQSWSRCIGGYTYPNGIRYFGYWMNDYASGEGVIFLPNKNMYIGNFSNDKAIGRGAIVDRNGSFIKAGYASSPEIGSPYFLSMGDSFISAGDGSMGYEQVVLHARAIQGRLEKYIDLPSERLVAPKTSPTLVPNQRYINQPPGSSGIESKVSQQKQKCIRLGLIVGSDDFKLCMQQ